MNEEERIREEFKQNFGYELMHKFNIKSGSLCEEITYFAFTNLLSIKGIRLEADNQDLPEQPTWCSLDGKAIRGAASVYQIAQQDMLKDGWVKCRDRGKKDPTAGFTEEEIADIRHNACDDTIG